MRSFFFPLLLRALLIFLLSYISPAFAAIPQYYHHTNLLRTIDLTKPYVRDFTALILENISPSPQSEYYWGIPKELVPKLAYLEVREKKQGSIEPFPIEEALSEDHPFLKIYKITVPELRQGEKISLIISSAFVDCLVPHPRVVEQEAKQYLLYTADKYVPTLYDTLKQKTKIKFNGDIEFYTPGKKNMDGDSDPQKSGNVLTYGPYGKQPVTMTIPERITIHFEYTAPITYVDQLERHIEVSHWGSNIAIEERYKLTNHAARLKNLFSRLQYTRSSYLQPPTHALTKMTIPLRNGARNPYYTDIIGNVSTSRFRPARGTSDAHLEIRPRYPVYGGWNYTFQIGWNVDLYAVERIANGERILQIPFLEGPDNIQYEKFQINIVLPEGARNVRVLSPQTPVSEDRYLYRTFLDSLGRTAVRLTFENMVDEKRGRDLVVIYEYPRFEGLRKVIVVAGGIFSIFVARIVGGWIFGVDVDGK